MPVAGTKKNPRTVKILTDYFNKLNRKLAAGRTSNKLNKTSIPNKNKEGSIKKRKKLGIKKIDETTRGKLEARMKLFLSNSQSSLLRPNPLKTPSTLISIYM